MKLKGRRVIIEGEHPHKDEQGIIKEVGITDFGYGMIIELDNCPHGTKECFVSKDVKTQIYPHKHEIIIINTALPILVLVILYFILNFIR